jgi:hypothetical protein
LDPGIGRRAAKLFDSYHHTRSKTMQDSAAIFLPLSAIFVVLGLVFGYLAIHNWRRARASLAWPTVQGQVLSAFLQEHTDSDEGVSYDPKVTYTYTVSGTEYQNDQIAFGGVSSSSKSKAQAYLERYIVEDPVTVHYDPDNPKLAVLEPRASGKNLLYLVVSAIFLGGSVWLLLLLA